jgi:hypothetical protein
MELGEGRGFIAGVVDGLRYVRQCMRTRFLTNAFGPSAERLARRRSKLGANRWPRKSLMAVMMARRMTTTWNSELTFLHPGVVARRYVPLIDLSVYIPYFPLIQSQES